MKKITMLLLIITGITFLQAGENVGTTGFAFARLSFSPRASAMGSAYNAVSDDAEAVFYNPGGLFQIKERQINAIYMNYLEGINCGSLLYAIPGNNNSAYAFYSRFLSTSETRTLSDEQGNYLGTDGEFGFSDLEIGASYSHHISQSLSLGGTTKVLVESIDGNTASMLAIDLGLFHITQNKDLQVGISLCNVGFQTSYFTDSDYQEKLPAYADLGFSYQFSPAFLMSMDLYKEFANDFYFRIGSETALHKNLKLRLGYKSEGSDWRSGGDDELLAGLTGGFGINWSNYEISYAFLSYGNLGIVNQLGIKYKFIRK